MDSRSFDDRPEALALYDMYYGLARRHRELAGLSDPSTHDIRAMQDIEEVLNENTRPLSYLEQVFGAQEARRYRTGDRKLDQWYSQLDQGEIPDEFWGPKGKPKGEVLSWGELMKRTQE